MSRFGEDPLSFFDAIYHGDAPWDIGGPQPAMADLVERFPPAGPILDIGCGTGDLALHLAGMGHRVMGIDFAERAIAQAQERAAGLPPETAGLLDFRVADGLNPAALGMSFGAVFDSGFYHLFDPDDGRRSTVSPHASNGRRNDRTERLNRWSRSPVPAGLIY
jgi:SAM-dependent methyltransferase